jgi:hypothetical protein
MRTAGLRGEIGRRIISKTKQRCYPLTHNFDSWCVPRNSQICKWKTYVQKNSAGSQLQMKVCTRRGRLTTAATYQTLGVTIGESMNMSGPFDEQRHLSDTGSYYWWKHEHVRAVWRATPPVRHWERFLHVQMEATWRLTPSVRRWQQLRHVRVLTHTSESMTNSALK